VVDREENRRRFAEKNERRRKAREAGGRREDLVEARALRRALHGHFGRMNAVNFNWAAQGTAADQRAVPKKEKKSGEEDTAAS